MGVSTTESVTVPAAPPVVFPLVADLARYPEWMRLVHRAEQAPEPIADDEVPAWAVELRARVGPFARSKQLRMIRTVAEPDVRVEFERRELDGRRHARWWLGVELRPVDHGSTVVTMHLAYDGALWTGGLLDRVLDDEIRRGRAGLTELVDAEPTR